MKVISPNLDLVRRVTRVRICANCPRRTPDTDRLLSDVPRPCERGCPLFEHLPQLKRLADAADPMLGSRQGVLLRYLHEECPVRHCDAGSTLAERQRKELVQLLDELEGG